MPASSAAAWSRAGSGRSRDAGGSVRSVAGTESARKNRSCPAGVLTARMRAVGDSTRNACGTPRGKRITSPVEARSSAPSRWAVNWPSST